MYQIDTSAPRLAHRGA